MPNSLMVRERYSITVCAVCAIHTVWAVTLLRDRRVDSITGINSLVNIFDGVYRLPIMLGVAVILAIVGMTFFKQHQWWLFLLIPQQILLFLSAGGQLESMILGIATDGTTRSVDVLITAQCEIPILAIAHLWALWKMAVSAKAAEQQRYGG